MIDMPATAALLLVDLQQGWDDPRHGPRNNPAAEANAARLLEAWRAQARPVLHARRSAADVLAPFEPDAAGFRASPLAAERAGEPVYVRQAGSAFVGTSLEADLLAAGIDVLVVAGLTSNRGVAATARAAGDLGFRTFVAADACAAFARLGFDGLPRPAEAVHAAALGDLCDDFAVVATTDEILAAAAQRRLFGRPVLRPSAREAGPVLRAAG